MSLEAEVYLWGADRDRDVRPIIYEVTGYKLWDLRRLTTLQASTACYCYMKMMFVRHRKRTYEPPRPVTGRALVFLYVDDVRTSQETYLWASMACYGETFSFFICR
jgi:hypothetical protein